MGEGESLRVERAARMQPKWAFVGVGVFFLGMLLPICVLASSTGIYPLLVLLVHAGLFGTMSLRYGTTSTQDATFEEGTLEVSATTVVHGGKLVARRDELAQAFVVPTEQGTLLRLEKKAKSFPLFLRLQDEAEARRVLAALGFDPAHSVARMQISSGLLTQTLGRQLALVLVPLVLLFPSMFAALAFFREAAGPFMLGLIGLFMAYVLTLAFAPTTVRIGTDGLVMQWLGRPRFLSYTELSRVERFRELKGSKEQRGVRLHLRSGEVVVLPTGQTDLGDVEAARLAERIEESRLTHAARSAGPSASSLIRGEGTALEWVRTLRRIGEGAFTARTSALPPETLLDLVEDSSAPSGQRASAAVAVLASTRTEARHRIRVAAQTTAEPNLRVALERIERATHAGGEIDEDEMAVALDELDTLDARARAQRVRRSH